MRPNLPVKATSHTKYRKCNCQSTKYPQHTAFDQQFQDKKCTDMCKGSNSGNHGNKGFEITMNKFHWNLKEKSVMSINTRNIMRIWHSLINIVDRIEICVPMVSIAQFSSSKNIRCVHTVKNEEHQRCIYQPDNPLTVFFRKADILTCPEKDCKFCQKQKCCDHCRLCVPSVFRRHRSKLFRLF